MNEVVKQLQQILNSAGYRLAEDGQLGEATLAALQDAVTRGIIKIPQQVSTKLVPKKATPYDIMHENSNADFGQYPIESIQDWGNYQTIVTPSGKRIAVQDVIKGLYTGNVPAYIENGVLKAGNVPTNLAYNDYINDNALANQINKQALDEYLETEYAPERIADAVTGGIFHRLSPTQNARLLYDAATGGDWRSSMIYGNNGVVSDQFASRNPLGTAVINMAGDLAVFNAGNISRMFNPTRLMTNARASYNGTTPLVGSTGVHELPRGGRAVETVVTQQNGRTVPTMAFGTDRGQITYGNRGPRRVNKPSKHGSPGYKGNGSTKVTTNIVSNDPVPVTDSYNWYPAIPQWSTTGASLSLLPKVEGPSIVSIPYHHDVVRNFHDDGWIQKYRNTPEGQVFWHNGKSYIKQSGGRDRFVRMQYNDGYTPMGQSADQVYFDRGVSVVEVPYGTPVGTTRNAGADTGNIDYNNAVNRNTGKQEKSKVTNK